MAKLTSANAAASGSESAATGAGGVSVPCGVSKHSLVSQLEPVLDLWHQQSATDKQRASLQKQWRNMVQRSLHREGEG